LLHGILLVSFGYLMYKFGQWGGGDAKVLAAIGFFSPLLSNFAKNLVFPFVFSYLVNVFVVGAAYMLLYAFVLAILNKKIMHEFSKSVKANSKMILISSPILFFIFFSLNFYLFKIFGIPLEICSLVSNSVLILALSFAFLLIWIFVKCVENVAFKKKIPVTKLKPGDVLLESKVWEGLTREEVKKIKASGKKFVWIKEGVRFAPTFPLALILTLLYGDFLIALLF
jgi:prepilin signal peptidase PulO-like enzyme (type II secretory pathway)